RQGTDDVVHVAAGAEVAFRAGDDHALHLVHVRKGAERVAQFRVGFEGQRVLALGAIERDGGDAVGELPTEMLRGECSGIHSSLLPCSFVFSVSCSSASRFASWRIFSRDTPEKSSWIQRSWHSAMR